MPGISTQMSRRVPSVSSAVKKVPTLQETVLIDAMNVALCTLPLLFLLALACMSLFEESCLSVLLFIHVCECM